MTTPTCILSNPNPGPQYTDMMFSLGKLLVNLLEVVERTNTPTNNLNKWRRRQEHFFLDRWFESHIRHHTKLFQTLPMSNLKRTLPGTSKYPGNETPWILAGSLVYPADLLSRRFKGASVLRLSLGKLLVNLLQVVKRTNTPLITLITHCCPSLSSRAWSASYVGAFHTFFCADRRLYRTQLNGASVPSPHPDRSIFFRSSSYIL